MSELIDNFVDSLSHYLDMKKQRDKCYSECEYDASYFCYSDSEALENASSMLKDSLQEVIRDLSND